MFLTMHALRRIFLSDFMYLPDRIVSKRNCGTSLVPVSESIERRNYLFYQEKKKQLEEVGRVEKVPIEVQGPPEDIVLVMNQEISTPYDCCKHISKGLCQQSPLALINDSILWDMHRPLPGPCTLKFLNFKGENIFSLNKAFWRTGSFILGAVISKAFKDNIKLYLHSFPPPVVKSGSFVYDVKMNLYNWEPTEDELKVLSSEFLTFVHQNLKIEPLKVKKTLALEIFEDNPFKQKQIPQMADKAKDHLITLYKVGDHIDMSCGPMIADTSFFGRCAVAAVHQVTSFGEKFYRFQGVALPKGILLNQFAFSIIIQRAERLNEACPPGVEDPRYSYYGTSGVIPTNTQIDVPSEPFHTKVF